MTSIEPTPSAYDYQLIIKHLLNTSLANAPDQEIVYRGSLRHTYRRMGERVGQLAHALESLGVGEGDTVAVMDFDSHRYLECFFAVPMMGAVLHTVNVRLSPEQILYTINHAKDDVILVHAAFLPILEQVKDRMETVKRILVISDGAEVPETSLELAGEYELLLAAQPSAYAFRDFDENTRATTFYTTGTTGLPKGVYFSHRQLVLHTLSGLVALGTSESQGRFHRGDVYMPITPMFHVHAWGVPYMATVLGVKQVYPGMYAPDLLLELIEQEGVTLSHCVPTIMHMLMGSPKFADIDLSKWKVCIGGAALPKTMALAVLEKGVDIFAGYGMSETCPILTLSQLTDDMLQLPVEEKAEILCKTGRPIPLVDLRIVDEQMNDVAHNGEDSGEIVVRAPWLTQGYVNDPNNSESLWAGGYLHTNDVAQVDRAGYVKITDRLKDMIKTGGEWLSSLELEDIIAHHSSVSEVAVIGVPDQKWGERPIALVVKKESFDGDSEEQIKSLVLEFVHKGLISKYAVPDRVIFVDVIDKTSVGKVNKRALRERYAQP